MSLSRRDLLHILSMGVLRYTSLPKTFTTVCPTLLRRVYRGVNLEGWRVVVGDGICAAPGETLPVRSDLQTIHFPTYSELRANIHKRHIMAHNITFKRIRNPNALCYTHSTIVRFRLPYLPSTANTDVNAQTVESALFVWDGPDTRLDYGTGWQWRLNPYVENEFGQIYTWTDSGWEFSGNLAVDTLWHTARLTVNFVRRRASLTIDGVPFPIDFTRTVRPDFWGTTVDARFQVENISLYVCDSPVAGTLNRTQFKNWSWIWEQ